MSLENIYGAVVLVAVGLVILLHPDKFRYSSKQIKQFISRYWWISVFVLLGYLTMGEWKHLFMQRQRYTYSRAKKLLFITPSIVDLPREQRGEHQFTLYSYLHEFFLLNYLLPKLNNPSITKITGDTGSNKSNARAVQSFLSIKMSILQRHLHSRCHAVRISS